MLFTATCLHSAHTGNVCVLPTLHRVVIGGIRSHISRLASHGARRAYAVHLHPYVHHASLGLNPSEPPCRAWLKAAYGCLASCGARQDLNTNLPRCAVCGNAAEVGSLAALHRVQQGGISWLSGCLAAHSTRRPFVVYNTALPHSVQGGIYVPYNAALRPVLQGGICRHVGRIVLSEAKRVYGSFEHVHPTLHHKIQRGSLLISLVITFTDVLCIF